MKKELESLKAAVQQMTNASAPATAAEKPAAPPQGPPPAANASEEKQVATATTPQAAIPSTEVETVPTESSGPLATHSFSIVGDAEVQFGKIAGQHGAFMLSDFAPIFLFRGGDQILFASGFYLIITTNAPAGS